MPSLATHNAPAEATAASPVISLTGLVVRYGRRTALDQLTATLSGRAIGLLGPNGAGKSTLISALLGFLRPTAGTARLLDLDLGRDDQAIRSRIGYMPENDAFVARMNAVTLTRMMGELSGLPPAVALERAHECLFYVGLGEARYRPLGTYSQGMRQMAKLAQAIVHGPQLLILDEPTNSLDPPGRERMLRLIREIRDRGDIRIILCSHLLRDVEEICDEVLILKQGRAVHHGKLGGEAAPGPRLLELELGGEPGDFAAALQSRGCELACGARRWKAILPPEMELRDVYQLAAERSLELRRVQFRRDTLEDIFLRAMEDESAGA